MAPRVRSETSAPWGDFDLACMLRAMELARVARDQGEVPVGAVLAREGQILGEGWNRPVSTNNPMAHAEIEALLNASQREANYRLPGSTLYVTLEPCVMCAGAIVTARIQRLVFAARDLRFGAIRSKFQLADSDKLNHRVSIAEGLLGTEATELLAGFFKERRDRA